jgi:hypothetical protein
VTVEPLPRSEREARSLPPRLRKLLLTLHVTFSVGWLGAVAAFLALAISGLVAVDPRLVRADYLAMDLVGGYVVVPLSFGALIVGLVQSLGTEWGLFRHYWVLVKLVLTVVATALLMLHMQLVSYLASVAAERSLGAGDLRDLRIQLVGDAGAALIVLLAATALSVYKPRGMTRRGRRAQRARRGER